MNSLQSKGCCTCGRIHLTMDELEFIGTSDGPDQSDYYNCVCHSTMIVPKPLAKDLWRQKLIYSLTNIGPDIERIPALQAVMSRRPRLRKVK